MTESEQQKDNLSTTPKGTATDQTRDEQLGVYRDQIDQLDADILRLMNQRLVAAESIGAIKQQLKEPAFYRPEREAQVLHRLRSINDGPIDDAGIESLFREIMSITRGSEAGLSTALLGPSGTFTEIAALQHFGSAIELQHFPTIDEIFKAGEAGRTNFAVVPIENSTEGGVNATLDRLTNTNLMICGEIYLKIHHNLVSQAKSISEITKVVSHPQSLGQCRNWLNRNLPEIERVACNSNAEAIRQASLDPTVAGIGAKIAAEKYNMEILAANIEDEPNNTTRFLVLSQRDTPPSGNDKTSLLISARNKPGALFHLLKPLVDSGIDMTKIESRPSKLGLWEYLFFVDIKGHCNEPEVKQALDAVRLEAGLYKHLGSYPRAK